MNKPVDTFKNRFNIAISNANIKPAELAEKTKLSKSTISHYMSGYTQPKSDKLFTLSKALNVNEAWLMGFDVPMEQSTEGTYTKYVSADSIAFEITGRSLQHSPQIFDAICNSLKEVLKDNLIDYTNGTQTLNAIEFLKSPDISYNKKAAALRRIINMVLNLWCTDRIEDLCLSRDHVRSDSAGVCDRAVNSRCIDHMLSHIVHTDIHDLNGIQRGTSKLRRPGRMG